MQSIIKKNQKTVEAITEKTCLENRSPGLASCLCLHEPSVSLLYKTLPQAPSLSLISRKNMVESG